VLASAIGLFVALPCPATAAPGDADSFFGGDGRQTAFPAGASGYAVAIDHHGRIVVAGYTLKGEPDIALARFTPGGRLDPTFDGDGKVLTDLGGNDYAFDLAIDPDGMIVVAGERDASRDTFAVVRYRPNGSLDPTFGNGGVVLTSFGRRFQSANAVALGRGGAIVVAGATSNGSTSRSAMARYRTDGRLDRTFGRNGKVTTDLSPSDERFEDVAVLSDGRVLAAGYAEVGLIPAFSVARFLPEGRLDRDFGRGSGGFTTMSVSPGSDIAHALVVQPDGRIVLAGYAAAAGADEWGLARLGPKGRLDAEFGGGDGIANTSFGAGYDYAFGLAIQANGKLVVAGRAHGEGGRDDMAVVRLKPRGGIDHSFGEDGLASIDFFGAADLGRDVIIQENGKVVIAGECIANGKRRMAVARIRSR
jgi:uncharacterized delta-60 repeat protein